MRTESRDFFRLLLQEGIAGRRSSRKLAGLDRGRTEIDGISRRTKERQGKIDGDKIPGLERSVSYRADPSLLSAHKLKSENVTHEVNHEYSRKRQNGDIRRF